MSAPAYACLNTAGYVHWSLLPKLGHWPPSARQHTCATGAACRRCTAGNGSTPPYPSPHLPPVYTGVAWKQHPPAAVELLLNHARWRQQLFGTSSAAAGASSLGACATAAANPAQASAAAPFPAQLRSLCTAQQAFCEAACPGQLLSCHSGGSTRSAACCTPCLAATP
jgi:hypothetical protein